MNNSVRSLSIITIFDLNCVHGLLILNLINTSSTLKYDGRHITIIFIFAKLHSGAHFWDEMKDLAIMSKNWEHFCMIDFCISCKMHKSYRISKFDYIPTMFSYINNSSVDKAVINIHYGIIIYLLRSIGICRAIRKKQPWLYLCVRLILISYENVMF